MKAATGLLLLSSSVMHMDAVWSYAYTRTFTPDTLFVTGRWVFLTLVGLWFLVPGFFDRTAIRWGSGIRRLLLDLLLAGLGLWLSAFWLALVLAPDRLVGIDVPGRNLLPFALLWGIGYVLAFLYPGYAFRRLGIGAEAAVAAELPQLSRAGANYAALTASQVGHRPQDDVTPRKKSGAVAIPFAALGFLAAWSWGHPLWFPSAELQALLADRHQVVLTGFGIVGAVLGWMIGGHPQKPIGTRLVQKTLAAVTVAGLGAFGAVKLASIGLPYVASFAMNSAPTTVEVSVVSVGAARRRKACDYTASVRIAEGASPASTICGIPPALWEGLRAGDRLILSGPGNRFGLRYDTIRPAP